MKINQLKAGALLSYINIGLGSLISIVYTPVMLRLLGQSEYGLYNLVASVVAYLGLFNFGFGSAYIKYHSAYKVNNDEDAIARLNGMFLLIFLVLGALALICGAVLTIYSDAVFGTKLSPAELEKAKILMVLMVANIGITFPCIVFNSYVTANERFIFQRLLQIVKVITSPFLILPVLIMGYGSIGMAVVTTVINLLIELINIYYSYKKIHISFSFKRLDIHLVKELFIFSFYIFINLIVNQINWNVDRFIIGRFRGTAEVAIYSVAGQLNSYYLQLSVAISNVYIPRVNALVAQNNGDRELSELFTRIGRLQFLLLSGVLLGLIFFGKLFIMLWAGANYQDAYPIALLLIIPTTIPLIQNLGIEIQRAKNMHKFRSWVYLFIAVFNVLLSIPLVKLYGGLGAALGTALALIVGNVLVMNWYYHKKVGLNIVHFTKEIIKILPALILPAIVGILLILLKLEGTYLTLLIQVLIFVFVFIFSMWKFGMNNYEKDLVLNPLKKLFGKLKK
ncbi:MAG: oligosaccharide flippase family protein [Paludibacter sp.]|nr:oligosaccharide flippase family protein [Paludibacter sp.]